MSALSPLHGFKPGDRVRAPGISSTIGTILSIEEPAIDDWSALAVVEVPVGFTDKPMQRLTVPVAQLVKA